MYKCENCKATTRRRKKIFTGSDGLMYCKQCFDNIVRYCAECGKPHKLNTLCDCVKEEPEAPKKTRDQKRQDKEVGKAIKKQTYTHAIYPAFGPNSGILPPVPPEEDNDAYGIDINVLAAVLAECGVLCYPVAMTAGPSSIQYAFNLANLKQFKAASRAVESIEARLRTKILFSLSPNADFSLGIARENKRMVTLNCCVSTKKFTAYGMKKLAVALGFDIYNNVVTFDMAKTPHLLVAGTTGSGKTVAMHTMIASMLLRNAPKDLGLVMIDPKQTELTMYEGFPHLELPISTNPQTAITVLNQMCEFMDLRYSEMKQGKTIGRKFLVVIDELADLMLTSGKAVETPIVRLAQMGRAAGIHLLVATQRPMATVLTGLIKSNLPSRLCLRVMNHYDSKMMDIPNAEKLSNHGDALFRAADSPDEPIRLQCAYTSDSDIKAIKNWWNSPESKGNINSDGYAVDLAGNVLTEMGKVN